MGDKWRRILEVKSNLRDFPDKKEMVPRDFDRTEIPKGIKIERRGIDF